MLKVYNTKLKRKTVFHNTPRLQNYGHTLPRSNPAAYTVHYH